MAGLQLSKIPQQAFYLSFSFAFYFWPLRGQ